MSRIILLQKTNFPGVACSILLYYHYTVYAIDARILLHRENVSNATLAISLVLSMLPTTWLILSKTSFFYAYFIAVHVVLTEKSLSNGIKFFLNPDPSSKINFHSLGYLGSHTSLNIWDILAEDWSMIGTFSNSNHPVTGSIKVVHNNWSSLVNILLSGFMTLASIVYVPMRYTYTLCHGVKVSASLAGSNPYIELWFLNFRQSLQILHIFRDWSTISHHLQMVANFWLILSPPGCWIY